MIGNAARRPQGDTALSRLRANVTWARDGRTESDSVRAHGVLGRWIKHANQTPARQVVNWLAAVEICLPLGCVPGSAHQQVGSAVAVDITSSRQAHPETAVRCRTRVLEGGKEVTSTALDEGPTGIRSSGRRIGSADGDLGKAVTVDIVKHGQRVTETGVSNQQYV